MALRDEAVGRVGLAPRRRSADGGLRCAPATARSRRDAYSTFGPARAGPRRHACADGRPSHSYGHRHAHILTNPHLHPTTRSHADALPDGDTQSHGHGRTHPVPDSRA